MMKETLLYILQNIIVIDCLIIVVFVFDKMFQWKSGHLWRKILWVFICFRMIFPVQINLQNIYENWKPIEIEVEVEVPVESQVIASSEERYKRDESNKIHIYEPALQTEGNRPVNTDAQQKAGENFSIIDFLKDNWEMAALGIWLLGFIICLFYHIFQYYLVRDFYLEEVKISDNVNLCSLTKTLCDKYGIRNIPNLLEKEDAMTPMTFGYFKRQMIFPLHIYENDQLSLVVRHELIHLKYLDSWYKTLVLVVCDLYWFNPAFLLMKQMAFSDVEFVCDERMQKELSEEELQNYGAAIVKTGRNISGKNVPSMVQFAVRKKELKKRLNNLFEFRGWRNGIVPLALCMVGMVLLIGMVSLTIKKIPVDAIEKETGEVSFAIPEHDTTIETFYTDDLAAIAEQKDVESSYITERFTAINHYYVDEQGVLWGTGRNDCWQLGVVKESDLNNHEAEYKEPVKIAENVIHVDANINGEFVVYLTKEGKLYGLGANIGGVLRMPQPALEEYVVPYPNYATEPQLLIADVQFASAGQECISVLTEDGNVWWWGKIAATTGTADFSVMYSEEPKLMVKNARYAVSGPGTIAAIDNENNLWLWGCNVFGQCGKEGADYLLEPHLACEDVEMVWPEFFSTRQNVFNTKEWTNMNPYTAPEDCCIQAYVIFIRKTDGKMYACGMDIGHNVKKVQYFGDLYILDSDHPENYTRNYSPNFLEITVEQMKGRFMIEEGEEL